MSLDGFRKFTEVGRSFVPKISIRANGQIGFNNGSVKRFKLLDFSHVVAYYNSEQKKIAMQFTNDGEAEGAMKIIKNEKNYFFSGKSFLDFHTIDYNTTLSREVEWLEEEVLAIIALEE